MNASPPEATAVGRVVCVNDRGIKFEGAESWSNVSKYAVGVLMPQKGEVVRVTFDRQGFIRSVAPADGAEPTSGVARSHAEQPVASSSTKDRTITRLACLKAAAEYAASKPQSSSADVLTIATYWEKWVLRDTSTDDEGSDR